MEEQIDKIKEGTKKSLLSCQFVDESITAVEALKLKLYIYSIQSSQLNQQIYPSHEQL
jgi:hypothetical protein